MTRVLARSAAAGVALCAGLVAAAPAQAHPLRFGTLAVEEGPGGEARAHLRFSGSERRPDAAEIVLPDGCADRAPATVAPIPYGVERERALRCPPGALARGPVGVRGIGEDAASDPAQVVMHLSLADGTEVETTLDPTAPVWRPSSSAATAQTTGQVVSRYAALGVEHILLGFDHLLFLAVLLLMVRGRRPLLVAVTAFTVGHSLTLALAVLDVVRVPTAAVETAIAISIAVVAAEVVRRHRALSTDRSTATATATDDAGDDAGASPPNLRTAFLVPAAFGLVHGLGFAGALRELGLPTDRLAPALVSFNLGVEAGQLLFVAAALGLVALARRLPTPLAAPRRLAPLAVAYGAGVVAAWLCIERLAA